MAPPLNVAFRPKRRLLWFGLNENFLDHESTLRVNILYGDENVKRSAEFLSAKSSLFTMMFVGGGPISIILLSIQV